MSNREFTDLFRAHARESGMDLIGIAPIERFSELPPERHPATIFPEVRSVVVVGKRIVRGALRGVEEGTQFELYHQYGRDWLNNRMLALATFKTSEFLEDHGWEAVPLPNLPPETPPLGVPVRKGSPAPNVMLDFDDAAVRAGLGEIGMCGFLLTPVYGPRQRLQMILTDAELTADSLLSDPICSHCLTEGNYCPLNAIDAGAVEKRVIWGKEMPVAKIDFSICGKCHNGATPNPLHPSGKPDRMAAACARGCVCRLEADGRLENTFQNPFRSRPAWGVVEERRIL